MSKAFIALLTNSEYGVEVPYGHNAYTAYVATDDENGGYYISYQHGMMPPHDTDHAATAADAAALIAAIADLRDAREIEAE